MLFYKVDQGYDWQQTGGETEYCSWGNAVSYTKTEHEYSVKEEEAWDPRGGAAWGKGTRRKLPRPCHKCMTF